MTEIVLLVFRGVIAAGLPLLTVVVGSLSVAPAAGGESESPAADLLVVELFTSQGCSSCPPADALLRTLAAEGRIGNKEVVPLAFHVDYWNYLGWRDPFSSAAWSQRQRTYAEVLPGGRLYTPQVVLNGRAVVGGWDAGLIRETGEKLPSLVAIELESVERDPLHLTLIQPTIAQPAALFVARVESGFATPVARGENADRKLRNDHVVRSSIEIELDPNRAGESLVIELPAHEEAKAGLVVALVRDLETRAILAAGWRALDDED